MTKIIQWIRGFLLAIVAAVQWVWRQVKWVAAQFWRLLSGLIDPVAERLGALFRAIRDRIEQFVSWLLDIWHRLWRTGKSGDRIREERVGANAAPLLATLTLAAVWYLMPTARWLGLGPGRFILWGFLIWTAALITWLSRCRADRAGRVARFTQRVYRATGLRRLDQLMLIPTLLLCYLVTREIQLLPLAFGALVSVVALLVIEQEPRPELAMHEAPGFPPLDPPDDDSDSGGETSQPDDTPSSSGRWINRRLTWSVSAHGRTHRHEEEVRLDRSAVDAARAANPGSADADRDVVDWVLHGDGPEIVDLARKIHEACFANAYSLFATVSCFVAATQSIEYVKDLESTGQVEYWRYPIETLADGEGDCEDSAILLAALLRRAGFRCAVLLTSNHAAVGVEVPHDTPGSYFEREGIRYYYCETTDEGWIIGSMPSGVELDAISFIPIPEWESAT